MSYKKKAQDFRRFYIINVSLASVESSKLLQRSLSIYKYWLMRTILPQESIILLPTLLAKL